MRVLLDTDALLWFLAGNTKLSQKAKMIIDEAKTIKLISIVSI